MNMHAHSLQVWLALYCILVFLAAIAGGWLIVVLRLNHTRMQMAVSAVAGLMLGIALLHFVPHAYHQNQSVDRTMQWALGGFLMMFFLQRLFRFHHHHTGEESEDSNPSGAHISQPTCLAHGLSWMGTTIGLSLHSIVDGVALTSAAFVDAQHEMIGAGLGGALAVILHKPFGAMAISTLMAASGCARNQRKLVIFLFALVTPVAAILFSLGANHYFSASPAFQGNALAFCAGTFLCIACADLLPELQFHSHDRLGLSIALLAGLLLAIMLGHWGHANHTPQHQDMLEDYHQTHHH